MPSLSGVRRAAFVDDSTQTVVRFDRAHEETQADVREMLGSESSDTRGDDYFTGYESILRWREPDLSSVSQLATWMTDRTRVQMVAVGPQKILQWYEPHYIRTSQTTNTSVGDVDPLNAEMRYAGGDGTDGSGNIVGYPNGSHRIYASRNALYPLAYDTGQGLVDTDGNDIPDGYTFTVGSFSGQSMIAGLYQTFGPTDGSIARRGTDLIMPIASQTWTLSVQVDQLHDDGDTFIELFVLSASGVQVASNRTTVSTTGRASVSITTPDAGGSFPPYTLRPVIAGIENASANNAKLRIREPALRVDGGTSYVTR